MKTISATLLLLALCSYEFTSAQAYVSLTNGEAVTGELVNRNSSFIRIRTSSGEVRKYTADQIEYIRNRSRDYYSKKMLSVNSKDPASVYQLVRLTEWGRINAYWYTDQIHSARYKNQFIEKGDSGLIWIGSKTTPVNVNRYKKLMFAQISGAVSSQFSDNPDLQKRYEAEKRNYNRNVILRYVKEYNQQFKATLAKGLK